MKDIPVYLFLGFLESGKTKFIQDTLCDERFNAGEKTLLIVCEEGVEEYEPSLFSGNNVTIKFIEEASEITSSSLSAMQKECKAERVIIEYNGMWALDDLLNNFPKNFTLVQCMTFADAQTFITYNNNMRNLTVDKLRTSELVVFNRMTKDTPKMELHKIVRGVSRRCDIAYEYQDGSVEYDDIEDPLPFDIQAPLIKIEDTDYALWYRDLIEETDKYNGKAIKFKGIVAYDKRMDENVFVAGRHVMTCCIDDVEYRPIVCICKNKHTLQSRDWIMVTGTIKNEYCKLYRSKGPVIYVDEIAVTSAPKQELATFY
ncbi:MAG: GTPase [Clostridia bacterium]|nr:GTPase [Clostridia bacterium]